MMCYLAPLGLEGLGGWGARNTRNLTTPHYHILLITIHQFFLPSLSSKFRVIDFRLFTVPQAWDLGYGFDMGVLYKTGWVVFFGSMATAAALVYFLS